MWTAKKTKMRDTYWILNEDDAMIARSYFGKKDAELIAKAPELLDALEVLLDGIKTGLLKATLENKPSKELLVKDLEKLIKVSKK